MNSTLYLKKPIDAKMNSTLYLKKPIDAEMNSTLYLKKPIDAEMNRFATAEGSISAKPWALAHGTHSNIILC